MRTLILGAGGVGSGAARHLSALRPDLDLRIADLYEEAAQRVAAELGPRAEGIAVDLHDPASLAAALDGVDAVLHTAGPFYRNARPVLEAAAERGIAYLDIDDDDDMLLSLLGDEELRGRAEESGARLVVGAGTTPGMSNLVARRSIDALDEAQDVQITMLLPLAVAKRFSPAVLDHMVHISTGEVLAQRDGEITPIPAYAEPREVTPPGAQQSAPALTAGHGETVMLARSFPHLQEVTVRLSWLGEQGNATWRMITAIARGAEGEIEGLGATATQVLVHLIRAGALDELLASEGVPTVGTLVEVQGLRNGQPVRLRTLMDLLGKRDVPPEMRQDPTAVAAAIGLDALLDGRVTGTGVLTPELCFDAEDLLRRFEADSTVLFVEDEIVEGPAAQ
ncbi:saccharopine dehydrogenase family protein [Brachybacterium sp. UMB0905]|uniref:saccharopine dehydrogenase family protein n=1 Tax=Brachybacterium sp. UMB0905 TaxID=2069310 RepID=UPI000C809993|nr:saccharopine dehydrogenase NADP-binding domain-containing protein [Brachybacterium sp. UMB0905]PMC75455.1 hypothetical protein CJ197_09015 [Brachybacterium sp. UMB0905]